MQGAFSLNQKKKRAPDSLAASALPNQNELRESIGGHVIPPDHTTTCPKKYSDRQPSQAADFALLGNITNYSSPSGTTSDALNLNRCHKKMWRFALLDAAQKLIFDDFQSDDPVLPVRDNSEGHFAHRTAYCRRALAYGSSEVGLVHYPHATGGQGAGGFSGLQHCGCVWGCPICGAIISERRRQELADVLDNFDDDIAMLTLTVQHDRSEPLEKVLEVLQTAYGRLFSGKSYVRLKEDFGVVGRVVGIESPYGKNGWHPHYHILLMIDLEKFDPEALEAYIKQQWTGILHRMGGYANWANGAMLSYGPDVRRDYLVKTANESLDMSRSGGHWTLAHEITKSGSKKGSLTPLRLLAATITGGYRVRGGLFLTARQAGRLWLEYLAAFHGVNQLRYCGEALAIRKALLQESEGDPDDGQTGECMAYLPHDVYIAKIVKPRRRGELAEVLSVGSRTILQEYLKSLAIDVPILQPGQQPDICRVRYDLDTDTMTEEILSPGDPGYEDARKAWAINQLRGTE